MVSVVGLHEQDVAHRSASVVGYDRLAEIYVCLSVILIQATIIRLVKAYNYRRTAGDG